MNSGGQRKPSEAGLREDGKHQCREELSAHLKHSPDTEIVSLGSGWRQPERQLLINGILGCAVKGAGPQRGYTRPGTGSLRPVAIGAVVEVTKLLKPLV